MPYLQQVAIDEAQGAVREAYDRDLADDGYVSNALTAAARSFFSKTLDAAGAQPDDDYASTATLLDLFPAPQNP